MTGQPTEATILPVDPYPPSLRLFAALGFFVGLTAGYLVTAALTGSGFCSPIGVIVGLIVGGGSAIGLERVLRGVLPSNRFLHIEEDIISFVFSGNATRSIDTNAHVNVTMWYFVIKRRSRVPKGWHVVALALEQDDVYLPAFTLMSPEVFAEFEYKSLFTHLKGSRKDYRDEGDLRLAGKHRQILTAETARSIDGVEMFNDEFTRLLDTLTAHFPAWMPKPTR